jgi:hypothetical protein
MTTKTRNWLLVLCIVALPFLIFFGFLASDFSRRRRFRLCQIQMVMMIL